MLPLLSLTPDRSTGSREAACQPARKNLQAGACGGKARAALRAAPRPFPPLSLMAYNHGRFTFLSEGEVFFLPVIIRCLFLFLFLFMLLLPCVFKI